MSDDGKAKVVALLRKELVDAVEEMNAICRALAALGEVAEFTISRTVDGRLQAVAGGTHGIVSVSKVGASDDPEAEVSSPDRPKQKAKGGYKCTYPEPKLMEILTSGRREGFMADWTTKLNIKRVLEAEYSMEFSASSVSGAILRMQKKGLIESKWAVPGKVREGKVHRVARSTP